MASKIGVGIDVGIDSIKFVKIDYSSQIPSVIQTTLFPLPGIEEENYSAHTAMRLKDFLKNNKFAVKEAIAGLTGEHINVRYTQIPPSSPNSRIAKIADMEVEQIADNSNTNLAYDYSVVDLEKNPAEEQTLLIVLARNGFLERLTTFFRQAGIHICYFVPNSLALYSTFIKFCDIPERETVYLAAIERRHIDLAIIRGSDLYFIRNLKMSSAILGSEDQTLGAEEKPIAELDLDETEESDESNDNYELFQLDLTSEDDQAIETMVQETKSRDFFSLQKAPELIDASLKFAQTQLYLPKLKASRLILTGGEYQQQGLRTALLPKLQCPIMEFDTFLDLDSGELSSPQSFFAAIGLAQIHFSQETPFQIISDRKRARDLLLKRQLFEYAAIAVLLLFIAFSMVYVYSAKSRYEAQAKQLEGRYQQNYQNIEQIKTLIQDIDKVQAKTLHLQQHIYPNNYFLETIALIRKKIPDSMYLTNIHFSVSATYPRKLKMNIKGVIEESFRDVYSVAEEFQKTLLASPLVAECEDKDPKLDEEQGRLYFELNLSFHNWRPHK